MGSLNPPPELTLDFKPTFVPKSIAQLLLQVSRMGSVPEKVSQVDDLVTRLESETRKIEAFKRELPLCMLLVNDAIVVLKEESMVLKKSSYSKPVLEEFIPLKHSCEEEAKSETIRNENENGDKKNWLSSTQLWTTNESHNQKANSVDQMIQKVEQSESRLIHSNWSQIAKTENAGRAFISLGVKNPMNGNSLITKISNNSRSISCSTPNCASNSQISGPQPLPPQQLTTRKQRRSWSTELHRRFIDALQQLGGSQAATPKQIRDLMRVDGLTNDEVKSHLQKYRLHMRRLPSSNTSLNQSDVVLGGGLWSNRDSQYVESSKCSNSQTGSPDGPLLNGGNVMDDDDDAKSENYCCNGNL